MLLPLLLLPVPLVGVRRAGERKDLGLGLTKGWNLHLVPKGFIWDQA